MIKEDAELRAAGTISQICDLGCVLSNLSLEYLPVNLILQGIHWMEL